MGVDGGGRQSDRRSAGRHGVDRTVGRPEGSPGPPGPTDSQGPRPGSARRRSPPRLDARPGAPHPAARAGGPHAKPRAADARRRRDGPRGIGAWFPDEVERMKRSSASLARGVLPRAIRYLGHYRRDTALAYAALLLATAAQLMVPLLIQRMIDGVTRGVVSQQTASLPVTVRMMTASRMGITLAELARAGQDPVQALVVSGMLILVFAAIRGLFAFSQAYMGERVSQSVAFDLRNDLFARIQRLSFSYHHPNQTGQLMIRATDDVEKVRLFIGQGLLQLV